MKIVSLAASVSSFATAFVCIVAGFLNRADEPIVAAVQLFTAPLMVANGLINWSNYKEAKKEGK